MHEMYDCWAMLLKRRGYTGQKYGRHINAMRMMSQTYASALERTLVVLQTQNISKHATFLSAPVVHELV